MPYTFTVTADTSISAMAYDPTLYNPDFSQASWAQLKNAVTAGRVAEFYSNNVGDTKSVTINGTAYDFRLAHIGENPYEYADGSGYAGMIFDCVSVITTSAYSSTSDNQGFSTSSPLGTTTLPNLAAALPQDLLDVIATVKVISGGCPRTSGQLEVANMTVFIPASKELGNTGGYGPAQEYNALVTWDYYRTHNSNTYRIKRNSSNTATAYWLRSYASTNLQSNAIIIGTGGAYSTSMPRSSFGISISFCL